MQPTDSDNEYDGPSKSQRKRDAHALQDLGLHLVELSANRFAQITLPEPLNEAVIAARAITQHGARKRQLQYIGKIMRNIDCEPIQRQLDAFDAAARAITQRQHQTEEWRDRLLADGDVALDELLHRYPAADRQHLRQLMRNAVREQQANQTPRAARLLFQYLRELLESG